MWKRCCKAIALSVSVIALILALCACDKDGDISMNYSNASAYTVADRGEITSVSAIEIDWVNGDILIARSDTAQAVGFYEVADGETPNNDTTMHYLLDANTLRIKYAKSGKTHIGKLKKNLYVTVPASESLWEIDVESVSGSIKIECDANEIDVEHVSGTVDISGKARHIDVESVSGNVGIECDILLSELDVETVSGNVCLRINENLGFRLEYDTFSGLMYNAFSTQTSNQGKYYVYLGGGCVMEIDSVSGSLTIEALGLNY